MPPVALSVEEIKTDDEEQETLLSPLHDSPLHEPTQRKHAVGQRKRHGYSSRLLGSLSVELHEVEEGTGGCGTMKSSCKCCIGGHIVVSQSGLRC